MPYLRDRAIVLRSEPFREQDLWLTCYGRALGKFVAVARGSRTLHAKHMGHLEPLSEIEVMLAKGTTFDKLAVARLIKPRLHVRTSLSAIALGGAAADFVDRFTHPGAPDPYIYENLHEVLDLCLETTTDITPMRGQFLFATVCLKILRLLGHVPDTDRCGECRAPLREEAYLLSQQGIIVCTACRFEKRRAEEGARLPKHAIEFFSFVSTQPLQECLKITATYDLLEAVQAMAMASLRQTQIHSAPHGFESIRRSLSPFNICV